MTTPTDPQKPQKKRVRRPKQTKPLEPPEVPDLNRCQAGMHSPGMRCALDVGHYRPPMDPKPSPHVSEDGTEWFGADPKI